MGDKYYETLDSLDYLVPAVKKSYGTHGTDLLFRDFRRRTDIRLIKDLRKKIIRQFRLSSISHESVQTSSSVILRKTEEVTIRPCALGNSKNKNKCNTSKFLPPCKERRKPKLDEPLIKVTILPREAESQISKVFYKRRDKTKKLQSTVSNQENCIKNQNVYFTVKGKRREKVYEIKSSESTNFSNKIFNTKYEDISIQQITNSKILLSSLNMEKKKQKNKKIEPNDNKFFNSDDICQKTKKIKDSHNVNAPKSKVTIVGQLGLTRDDQYVLKCAATVNDQPIAADYVQFANTSTTRRNLNQNPKVFTSNFEKVALSLDDRNNNNFRHKDLNVQTDICYAETCNNLNRNSTEHRMNSQATQVNLNPPRQNTPKGLKNKIIQCSCDTSTSKKNILNNKATDNVLQDCKSPLVIISVYPRQDGEDVNYSPVQIIQQPLSTQKKVNNSFKGTKGRVKNDNVQSVNKPGQTSPRSRSPSPASKIRLSDALVDKKVGRIKGKNIQMNVNQPQRNANKSKLQLNNFKKVSSCYCPYSQDLGSPDFPKFALKAGGRNFKETDTEQVKQALVNNFLKSVDQIDRNEAKMKLFAPKNDTSRVSINIDGANEHYNVLFEQRDFDTGLSVRKTMKKESQILNTHDEIDSNSIENFLMLSDEIINDTPMHSRKTQDVSKVVPIQSRLNVRDSLEICHSRGSRGGLRQNSVQRGEDNLPDSTVNTNFKVPGKHYRGDNCSIPDPNERDKEIRELLGIVRYTRNPKKDEVAVNKDHKVFYSHPEIQKDNCWCCKKRSSRGLMTVLSISKLANKCHKNQNRISKARLKKCGARNIGVTELVNMNKKGCKNLSESSYIRSEARLNKNNNFDHNDEQRRIHRQGNEICINENVATNVPHTKTTVKQKNLILNRNIQMFLQIEQFTKQKPIILTRKQYEKVKRTIQGTINQRKCCNFNNFNIVSVGEIKIKPRKQQIHHDREIQTEQSEVQKTVRCIEIQTQHYYKNHRTKHQDEKHIHSHNDSSQRKEKQTIFALDTCNKQNQRKIRKTISTTDRVYESEPGQRNLDKTISTTDRNNDKGVNETMIGKNGKTNEVKRRETLSTMEFHHKKVAYTKQITVSSTHFGDGFHNRDNNYETPKAKTSTSLHTIFKGYRKSATPNLGTSAYSLCSGENDSTKSNMGPEIPNYAGDSKPKKPFLQKLLSCLVMRTTETTILKEAPKRILPSANSSLDSYHISTSLGAIEMTSSLYDTSASFYSNHAVAPTSKMKRGGFFSSVRGFLMTRRS